MVWNPLLIHLTLDLWFVPAAGSSLIKADLFWDVGENLFIFPTDKKTQWRAHKGVFRGCGILIADALPGFSTSAQRVQLLLFSCVNKFIKNSPKIFFSARFLWVVYKGETTKSKSQSQQIKHLEFISAVEPMTANEQRMSMSPSNTIHNIALNIGNGRKITWPLRFWRCHEVFFQPYRYSYIAKVS